MQNEPCQNTQPFSSTIFSTKNGRGPVTPFGVSGMFEKNKKLVWAHAYSMQKESCKNIQPFSCGNFLNNSVFLKWAWSCHSPRDADRTLAV